MTRPAHADPTLWGFDHYVMIASGYRPNPIAHRVEPVVSGWGDWWAGCDSMLRTSDRSVFLPHLAAHFALPCLRCWPDAKEGREATVAARAKAMP